MSISTAIQSRKTINHAESIYSSFLEGLSNRYGKHDVAEPFRIGINEFAGGTVAGKYAFYKWKKEGNVISLVLCAKFEKSTNKLVGLNGPEITIIYNPLIDGIASKL